MKDEHMDTFTMSATHIGASAVVCTSIYVGTQSPLKHWPGSLHNIQPNLGDREPLQMNQYNFTKEIRSEFVNYQHSVFLSETHESQFVRTASMMIFRAFAICALEYGLLRGGTWTNITGASPQCSEV